MSTKFLLFREKPFEAYALDKFSDIARDIDRMSEIEILMYKYCFDELVTKTVSAYQFKNLEVVFENQIVDLIDRPYKGYSNIYAEYSVAVKGDSYFLGLIPFREALLPFNLEVGLRKNVLSFEIDTNYHLEELSEEVTAEVKKEYDLIKRYILDNTKSMNKTIEYFNEELKKFVIPLLAEKLRKAERSIKMKEALNFQ